ncbi:MULTISPECIES: hypothetical protein [unclassified Streptomyces]|uniref:hypothetical protein n=1 Tax=unclassified Streptomyces TaxID=2593676 RepID=UPI002E75A364|nr:hypothetical protein [Streptomyces sp. JV184]MEE1749775.1 hypothetical protein [Streptomyces sp. JV184]
MSVRAGMIVVCCTLTALVAVLVAGAAGYLARRDSATYPQAVTRAAVAFGATLTLAAALTTALDAVCT